LPETIGVITSPTGAVIRDIIHRISDRFPRHLLVWPVLVQGTGAAEQVAAAIRGFNASVNHRPDILIVARGGGSLEDLMAFNEEIVVRAVAESNIPVISAVGHETDTTLIDYAADLRAPTPTAAAEMAVPVRLDLLAGVQNAGMRLTRTIQRTIGEYKGQVETLSAKLGDPEALINIKSQYLDHASSNLRHAFDRGLSRKAQQLAALTPRHPRSLVDEQKRHLDRVSASLARVGERMLADPEKRLAHAGRMLQSLSFESVLERGFAVVRTKDGNVVSDAAQAAIEDTLDIQFRRGAHIPVRKL
jgi:exodeoxyribonuclease VII large subunit